MRVAIVILLIHISTMHFCCSSTNRVYTDTFVQALDTMLVIDYVREYFATDGKINPSEHGREFKGGSRPTVDYDCTSITYIVLA